MARGSGRQAFESLLAEVSQNGDALLAQGRRNLERVLIPFEGNTKHRLSITNGGASTTPLSMQVRWWGHDTTEPFPAEVPGQDPFVSGTMLAQSAVAGCSQTVTVQSEALKPNRICLTVKSEYPARTTLPDERPNLGNEFRITVTRN